MKIESILKRPGGTKVQLGGKTYHFTPDEYGRHVAEVEDNDHIGRLLAIREGYRLLSTEPDGGGNDEPLTSGGIRPVDDGGSDGEDSGDGAGEDDPRDDEGGEDNAGAEDGEEGMPNPPADPVSGDELLPEDQDPATVNIDVLRARFEEIIGEKPHPRAKAETLQQRIKDTIEAAAE